MHLKNIGVRLVIINTPKPHNKSYQVIPASDAVEVPDNEINAVVQDYIDGLVNSGELVEVSAPKKSEEAKEPAKRGPKPKSETQE